MALSCLVFAALALAGLGGAGAKGVPTLRPTPRFSFRGAGQATQDDVRHVLADELAAHGQRTTELEDELRIFFTSLPKNTYGNLDHGTVRYALHRFFLKRHGWFIRGLEPSHAAWTPLNNATFVKEWVPNFLQEQLESRAGERGADLHGVAAVAASLEDLVKREATARLKMVYQAHGEDPSYSLTREDISDVLMTYFMSFLVANNFTVSSYTELLVKKTRFPRAYRNYSEAREWFETVVARHLGNSHGAADARERFSFRLGTEVVADISENYYSFNERECSSMKTTLSGMESRKAGRVRLSTFYNMTRYSHWRFTEKPDYLRSMGALDDTDPKNPYLIIPNYAMARTNCLDAFHIFTICCKNPCEDMMGHLEATLGGPAAEPARIAAIVAALPSESVSAPRVLPEVLLGRLDEIAQHHGGEVPMHGRLFAQWMHHAYPLECPYPHERGQNPQTASEWIEESGEKSTQATEEEMRDMVEKDSCGITGCEDESTDLPWVMEEELITHFANAQTAELVQRLEGRSGWLLKAAVAACAFLVFLASTLFARLRPRTQALIGEDGAPAGPWRQSQQAAVANVASIGALLVLGHCAELLNPAVLVGISLYAAVVVAPKVMSPRLFNKCKGWQEAKLV